jgi:hypothetical protein
MSKIKLYYCTTHHDNVDAIEALMLKAPFKLPL